MDREAWCAIYSLWGRKELNMTEQLNWTECTLVFLSGESPRTEETGGLQCMGLQRVGHDWATKHSTAQRMEPQTFPRKMNCIRSGLRWSAAHYSPFPQWWAGCWRCGLQMGCTLSWGFVLLSRPLLGTKSIHFLACLWIQSMDVQFALWIAWTAGWAPEYMKGPMGTHYYARLCLTQASLLSAFATPAWPSVDLFFLDSLTSDHSIHCCQVCLLKSPFKVANPCLKGQQGLFFVSRRILNTSISDRPMSHPHRPSNTLLMPLSQSLPISSLGLEFLLYPSPPSIYWPSPDHSSSQGFLQQIAYIVQHLNCSLDK